MVLEVQVSLKKNKGVISVFYFALTNCCKISGLDQHKFIILQFSVLEVCHGSHWNKIKVLAGLRSFLEALWRNLFSCLFQLSQAACSICLTMPFLHLQSQLWWPEFFLHHILLTSDLFFCLLFALLKILVITLDPSRLSRIMSLHQGQLINNLNSNLKLDSALLCNNICTGSGNLKMDIFGATTGIFLTTKFFN